MSFDILICQPAEPVALKGNQFTKNQLIKRNLHLVIIQYDDVMMTLPFEWQWAYFI